MNSLTSLTVRQLKRAVALKEKIAVLNKELESILGSPVETSAPVARKKRKMSAAGRAAISKAAKARWAKARAAKAAKK
jgi:hypothetical protein